MSGPLFENLLKLRDMMPKLAKGIASKKLSGRAKKLLPTKACRMCDDLYDRQLTDPAKALEHGFCPRCTEKLDLGFTAARHMQRRVWVKLPASVGLAGQFVNVIESEMDGLLAVYGNLTSPKQAPEVAPVCGSCPRPEPQAGSGPQTDPLSDAG